MVLVSATLKGGNGYLDLGDWQGELAKSLARMFTSSNILSETSREAFLVNFEGWVFTVGGWYIIFG